MVIQMTKIYFSSMFCLCPQPLNLLEFPKCWEWSRCYMWMRWLLEAHKDAYCQENQPYSYRLALSLISRKGRGDEGWIYHHWPMGLVNRGYIMTPLLKKKTQRVFQPCFLGELKHVGARMLPRATVLAPWTGALLLRTSPYASLHLTVD